MARELHGEVGQLLVAVMMELDSLRLDQPEIAERLRSTEGFLQQAITATRRIVSPARFLPHPCTDVGPGGVERGALSHRRRQHDDGRRRHRCGQLPHRRLRPRQRAPGTRHRRDKARGGAHPVPWLPRPTSTAQAALAAGGTGRVPVRSLRARPQRQSMTETRKANGLGPAVAVIALTWATGSGAVTLPSPASPRDP